MDLKGVSIGNGSLSFILGPCSLESEEIAMECASQIVDVIPNFVFKGSFDKANRSSINSFRGPGLKKGLEILKKIKDRFNIPVTTDVHLPEEVIKVSKVCDMIQIPALLCRQTDLIVQAGKSGLPINIKKGQFISPKELKYIAEKIVKQGNQKILFTERGTMFGYNNLVNDMRAIPIVKSMGYPICFDVSHSLRGTFDLYLPISKAAVAAGADVIFLEVHPSPKEAKCDGEIQLPLSKVKSFVESMKKIHKVIVN